MLSTYVFSSELLYRVDTPEASDMMHSVNAPKILGYLLFLFYWKELGNHSKATRTPFPKG